MKKILFSFFLLANYSLFAQTDPTNYNTPNLIAQSPNASVLMEFIV
nr:hypothetical protein [Pedobacter sp. ASV2]